MTTQAFLEKVRRVFWHGPARVPETYEDKKHGVIIFDLKPLRDAE
jgi:hypothetical protein